MFRNKLPAFNCILTNYLCLVSIKHVLTFRTNITLYAIINSKFTTNKQTIVIFIVYIRKISAFYELKDEFLYNNLFFRMFK